MPCLQDTYYPAVQDVGRLAMCISPIEVYSCCSGIVRSITALCPLKPSADDLIPLVSMVLHQGVVLGRIARTYTAKYGCFGGYMYEPEQVSDTLSEYLNVYHNLAMFIYVSSC